MCTVLLPPGVDPTAVNKYIKYQISSEEICLITKEESKWINQFI